VNSLVTNVTRFTSSNAKALGLNHLQVPDMGVSDGPPNGARVDHR